MRGSVPFSLSRYVDFDSIGSWSNATGFPNLNSMGRVTPFLKPETEIARMQSTQSPEARPLVPELRSTPSRNPTSCYLCEPVRRPSIRSQQPVARVTPSFRRSRIGPSSSQPNGRSIGAPWSSLSPRPSKGLLFCSRVPLLPNLCSSPTIGRATNLGMESRLRRHSASGCACGPPATAYAALALWLALTRFDFALLCLVLMPAAW